MHTIRNNCGYEFVKLCLRYTARDPRLRSYVWWWTAENNSSHRRSICCYRHCGEPKGGAAISLINVILANEQSSNIPNQIERDSTIVPQTAAKNLIEIQRLFNRKEHSFF